MSDTCGSDQDGDGTEQKPFKTLRVNALVALSSTVVYHNSIHDLLFIK